VIHYGVHFDAPEGHEAAETLGSGFLLVGLQPTGLTRGERAIRQSKRTAPATTEVRPVELCRKAGSSFSRPLIAAGRLPDG
jgi:hypothetical protein